MKVLERIGASLGVQGTFTLAAEAVGAADYFILPIGQDSVSIVVLPSEDIVGNIEASANSERELAADTAIWQKLVTGVTDAGGGINTKAAMSAVRFNVTTAGEGGTVTIAIRSNAYGR
jgi:hypothetical protein